MAFRWKNFETPEQTKAAYLAQQGMEGYVPNSAGFNNIGVQQQNAEAMMQGYNQMNVFPQQQPDQPRYAGFEGRAPAGMNIYGTGLRSMDYDKRRQIQARIDELETELADINSQIAAIDKATPGLARNPKEWEIAAKRAEIGDMSAYDNLVSRGSQDSSAATGIENELLNAEKLTWGLKSKDSETREAARKQAEVAIVRAEEWATKTGKELPSSYYRLKEALAAPEDETNANTVAGILWSKKMDGTLTEADRKYAKALHDADPNSADAKTYREIFEDTKGKTTEAKAAAEARKKVAKTKIQELQKLPVSEQGKAFDALDQKLKEDILKQAQWDTTGNRGLVWRR